MYLSVSVVAFIARLFIIRTMINLSLSSFILSVVIPCGLVTIFSFISSLAIKTIFSEGLINVVIVCVVSFLLVAVFAYTLGLSKTERDFINSKVIILLSKRKRHD